MDNNTFNTQMQYSKSERRQFLDTVCKSCINWTDDGNVGCIMLEPEKNCNIYRESLCDD